MANFFASRTENFGRYILSPWPSFILACGATCAAGIYLRRHTAKSKTQSRLTLDPQFEHSKCAYILDNSKSGIFTLPDGRKLGYAQYGSPTGRAILYQHGFPGSRIEAATYHDLAVELNARIIAIERPGYAWSSPHPTRTILDWPKDVQCLADHLGLEEYSVLGVSGGGPYALACAYSLPASRLKSVSIVCGLGPPDIGMAGANPMHYIAFTFGWRWAPTFLVRWFFSLDPMFQFHISDAERLERLRKQVYASKSTHILDRMVVDDTDLMRLYLSGQRAALAQGWEDVCLDGHLMISPWGFRIEDVRKDLPVKLLYGTADTFVPLNHGRQIAARLGDAAELRIEGDTHGSVSYRWRREVLNGMLKEMGD